MHSQEIRKKFLEFFIRKGHQIIPSSSLIPADPTALFTTAGMQQFTSYLSGEIEPLYRRAASCQKCFRTSDIDSVGDEWHHTFFEMLGNWSFGDYFKKEAINWAFEFLTTDFKFEKSKLWVTVFKGEEGIPKDTEAIQFWQKAGIPKDRIREFGIKDNFWGPVGEAGPCGPCSEIHYDQGREARKRKCSFKDCGPNCACGRFIEIWNLVFMEFKKTTDGRYLPLPAKNIDTGAGLERLAAILQNKRSNFETDLFLPIIQEMESLVDISYIDQPRAYRIIADHLRGICFLIADGVLPSKEDRGYLLRRIIRRAIRYGKLINCPKNFLISLAQVVINQYQDIYPELHSRQTDILTVVQNEEEKFSRTINEGLKKFKKVVSRVDSSKTKIISGKEVFHLYDTYGFPFELTKELAEERGLKVNEKDFQQEFIKHQEISRAGVKRKFGGLGISEADSQEEIVIKTKLHTATHLLHVALRQILGEHVQQAGSDINPERLRFDFTHPTKLSEAEVKQISELVNRKIKEDLPVTMKEMPYEEAIKSGALAFFKERYPKIVRVYSIDDYSQEICAGPHVNHTGEIGNFKIIKEESAGAGLRRIKAKIE